MPDFSEFAPDAIAAATESALRTHSALSITTIDRVVARARRVAVWAESGVGEMAGLKVAILEVAGALYLSPADRHYGRAVLADPDADTWVEDLGQLAGTDNALGCTLVAAGARLDMAHGKALLPRSLALLFRIDTQRIHVLVREGVLREVNAGHPAAGRAGNRPKGAEMRVTAESAQQWLASRDRAPRTAPTVAPKRRKVKTDA